MRFFSWRKHSQIIQLVNDNITYITPIQEIESHIMHDLIINTANRKKSKGKQLVNKYYVLNLKLNIILQNGIKLNVFFIFYLFFYIFYYNIKWTH